MNAAPAIIGLGLQTPVGLDLLANVAAVRSGLNSFRLSTLPPNLSVYDRMRTMALAAAQQAVAPLLKSLPPGSVPELSLLLAVPATRPGFPADQGPQLFHDFAAVLPLRLHKPTSALIYTGNDGALLALD